jgi:hypothetical protein
MDNPQCPWCNGLTSRVGYSDDHGEFEYYCIDYLCDFFNVVKTTSIITREWAQLDQFRAAIREQAEALSGLVSDIERGEWSWSLYQRIQDMGFRVCVHRIDEDV